MNTAMFMQFWHNQDGNAISEQLPLISMKSFTKKLHDDIFDIVHFLRLGVHSN